MINMMLFNPENPVILSIYRQGVFSLRRSEFGVGRSAFKGPKDKRFSHGHLSRQP
jgi:hypothetical protein